MTCRRGATALGILAGFALATLCAYEAHQWGIETSSGRHYFFGAVGLYMIFCCVCCMALDRIDYTPVTRGEVNLLNLVVSYVPNFTEPNSPPVTRDELVRFLQRNQ